jgi:hypothetical protein
MFTVCPYGFQELVLSGQIQDVPLLIGTNENEGNW